MRILIIRHGDPDYEIDGLTEKGKKEAELLTKRLVKENITAVYCSTKGRARLTAQPTLDAKDMSAEYCEWLREFTYAKIVVPYKEKPCSAWDFPTDFLVKYPELYSIDGWRNADFIKSSDYAMHHDNVIAEFDRLLEKHGYKRNGLIYDVTDSNRETIAIFCHHGLGSLLLARLLNCSPFTVSQNCCLPTSSVTVFYSEERLQGKAFFRMSHMGDISHLYAGGEPASFAGRFCECFDDETRH